LNAGSNLAKGQRLYKCYFSHDWFATVTDVLQADWHDAWHLPHPPVLAVDLSVAALIVLM